MWRPKVNIEAAKTKMVGFLDSHLSVTPPFGAGKP